MNKSNLQNHSIDAGVRRRFRIALFFVLASLPFVVIGSQRAIEKMRIAPERWVSATQPERKQFLEFREQFEGNDIVLISWDGCVIDDPRLDRFEQAVLSPEDQEATEQHERDYHRVVTGYSAIRRLTAPPLNLTQEQALNRLQGVIVGPDHKTSCALVVLTYYGNDQRAEAIERLKSLAEKATGLNREKLHVSGPPHDGVAIDKASIQSANLFSAICTILAAFVCAWCLRSWHLTAVIIGIACFGQGFALSLVYLLGLTLDAILIVVAPLIFVLTVSAGVHLVNYYADQLDVPGVQNPVVRALKFGWKPCLLAAITTAIGLGSLSVSQVTPIAIFGAVAAVSLLVTTIVLLCILPGALQRSLNIPIRKRSLASELRWEKFGKRICRWAGAITALCAAAMFLSADGLRNLSTSVDALSLFSSKSPVAIDYSWFESNIGNTVPIEVVVDFEENCPLAFRQRAEVIQNVHQTMKQVDGIGGVVSALTFAPHIPTKEETASFWRTALLYKRMEANKQEYINQHFLNEEDGRQSWRVGGRVSALTGADYTKLHQKLGEKIEPLVSLADGTKGISVRYTGMMPLIQNIQSAILEDLFRSFLTAFVLIALAIAFVLRSLRLTCAAMLPNLFPVLMIFGGMGWLRLAVDIGTVMTASVALGIAVDDTIHFLTSYRHQLTCQNNSDIAVQHAIGKSGKAMFQTTLICALGMLVFTASTFVPTQRFGLIMAFALVTALFGDLVFLPAILTSRLGRWLVGSGTDSQTELPSNPDPAHEKVLTEI